VTPTSANFLCCDLGEDAAAIAGRLLEEGIAVRPLRAWGAPSCIRVTIGRPEQNSAFLEAMRKVRRYGSTADTASSRFARNR
jgi:histidinol-phosphate aminotransferase